MLALRDDELVLFLVSWGVLRKLLLRFFTFFRALINFNVGAYYNSLENFIDYLVELSPIK